MSDSCSEDLPRNILRWKVVDTWIFYRATLTHGSGEARAEVASRVHFSTLYPADVKLSFHLSQRVLTTSNSSYLQRRLQRKADCRAHDVRGCSSKE